MDLPGAELLLTILYALRNSEWTSVQTLNPYRCDEE